MHLNKTGSRSLHKLREEIRGRRRKSWIVGGRESRARSITIFLNLYV